MTYLNLGFVYRSFRISNVYYQSECVTLSLKKTVLLSNAVLIHGYRLIRKYNCLTSTDKYDFDIRDNLLKKISVILLVQ